MRVTKSQVRDPYLRMLAPDAGEQHEKRAHGRPSADAKVEARDVIVTKKVLAQPVALGLTSVLLHPQHREHTLLPMKGK